MASTTLLKDDDKVIGTIVVPANSVEGSKPQLAIGGKFTIKNEKNMVEFAQQLFKKKTLIMHVKGQPTLTAFSWFLYKV